MRILLIGSGGREHALAWKIAQSPRLDTLFIAPGNGGTHSCGTNVPLDAADHQAVIDFCSDNKIDFVVIGPDAPVVAGLGDDLRAAGLLCFGPSKAAAQVEGSKNFTKALCDEMDIPTAGYGYFEDAQKALDYVRAQGAPIVIKADGLALGKGVTVAMTLAEAETAIKDCFDGAFGAAGAAVVIEEFLEGEEASMFVLCDGQNTLLLECAQDHKRAFDGDKGPNTGGMGAYSPAPVMTPEMITRTMDEIITPSVEGLRKRGTPYQGVLFAGLMITDTGPKLIEYNARFGDPECQVLMMRLKTDIVDLLEATASEQLASKTADWRDEAALTLVLATNGYPASYQKGSQIKGANDQNSDDLFVFHAGTAQEGDSLRAIGGRVLNVTALGQDVSQARDRAYAAAKRIDWPEGFCRSDIGWRAIERSKD